MSQFYDQASLVLIPSGYKSGKVYSQKPLSADGELTFTRASNATRVNADGLVEKVRQNVLLQSNSFDTTWVNGGTTETGGQSGYDGSNDAWLITKPSSGAYASIYQNVSSSGVQTVSFYAKAGSLSIIGVLVGGGDNPYVSYDLSSGTITGQRASVIDSTITSIGGGWYRCTMTFNASISDVNIYPDWNQTNTGNLYIQNAQLETGDIATDYIPTTSAAVSVGPVSGLPRLDYSGGCPSLLLEPQRSNLVLWSEQMDNAVWTKTRTSVTANATTSPDGYTNADKIVEDTTASASHFIRGGSYSLTSGTTYTFSIFVKSTERQFGFNFDSAVGADSPAIFNLSTGAVVANGSFTTNIESYTNGWYRCTGTFTSSATTTSFVYVRLAESGSTSYTGDGTSGAFVWGAQLEAGSYATSYIPTLGSAVTRLADAAVKTGISSLIGQTEGTIFLEFDAVENAGQSMNLINFNNSTSASALIRKSADGKITAQIFAGGSAAFTLNSNAVTGITKAAFAYKSGDSVLYVNGTAYSSSNTFTLGAALSEIRMTAAEVFFNFPHKYKTSQALLFKTRLTNAQLAELTAL